jgi:hypothetical protein
MITWPFSRGVWYTFADFSVFEEGLLAARRADPKLDADLRLNRLAWIKTRNEELYPTWYYRRHMGLPLSVEFRIGVEGADADIEIRCEGLVRRLQVTTAGPLWDDGPRDWGQDHALHMEQLNQAGQSSGWGPYRKQADGSITNRDEAISTADRDPAYLAGVRQTLLGKRLNQHSDCELIVYAGKYDQVMNLETYREIVTSALREIPLSRFLAIHVLAAGEGYIVSKPQKR